MLAAVLSNFGQQSAASKPMKQTRVHIVVTLRATSKCQRWSHSPTSTSPGRSSGPCRSAVVSDMKRISEIGGIAPPICPRESASRWHADFVSIAKGSTSQADKCIATQGEDSAMRHPPRLIVPPLLLNSVNSLCVGSSTHSALASSPSEDYLTVVAGQRQWIATTNCAGCPRPAPRQLCE